MEPRWARRLVFDIETSPNISMHWGMHNVNIAVPALLEPTRMICWAAKWVGEKKIHYADVRGGREEMLWQLRDLIDEADILIGFNSKKFDWSRVRGECHKEKIPQPSPPAHVDLYLNPTKHLGLPSNKLEFVADYFGIGQKLKHEGISLWRGCYEGDPKAWDTMRRYNMHDVRVEEGVYLDYLPLIENHPPVLLYVDDACNRCGCTEWNDGTKPYMTPAGSLYGQLKCNNCGGWGRPVKRDAGTTVRGIR